MTVYQPQVNSSRFATDAEWHDCRRSDGVIYGPFATGNEAMDILKFYDDGRAVLGITHRVKEIDE